MSQAEGYLRQRAGGTSITLTLVEDGVEVAESSLFSKRLCKVPLEHIGHAAVEVHTSSKPAFWFAAGFTALALVVEANFWIHGGGDAGEGAFYLLIAAFFAVRFWQSRQVYLVFDGASPALMLFKEVPSHEEVQIFLQRVEERKDEYLRGRYLHTAFSCSAASEIEKLVWLRASGVITAEEFDRLKQAAVDASTDRGVDLN